MILDHVKKRFPGDHPCTVAFCKYVADACEAFVNAGLSDPKFENELESGSDQKFWACISEALIFKRLSGKQFGGRNGRGKGPDFLVMDGTRKVWIEVVCPEPIGLPENWLNPKPSDAIHVPHQEILLRWTSAIKAKAEALIGDTHSTRQGYLQSGLVAADDAYVIAVNGCLLRMGPLPAFYGISQFPYAAEAVFPIGPIQLRLNRETLAVVERGHQHRLHVLNRNMAEVPTRMFLDPHFNQVSAIWAVDLTGGSVIGNVEPSAVIHNPNALNPIPPGFLPADDEYSAIEEDGGYVLKKADSRIENDG